MQPPSATFWLQHLQGSTNLLSSVRTLNMYFCPRKVALTQKPSIEWDDKVQKKLKE